MALPGRNVPVEAATSPDRREARRIAQAVEDIAVQFSRPFPEVQELLKTRIYRLDQRARIKQFVSLLAIKQVKELFKLHQRAEQTRANMAPEQLAYRFT